MITITDKGAEKVHEFLASQDADVSSAGLRVGVKGGGCSGFQYNLAFDEQARRRRGLRVPGPEGPRRQAEPALRARLGHRLRRVPAGRRLPGQQPERRRGLRLRLLVPRRRRGRGLGGLERPGGVGPPAQCAAPCAAALDWTTFRSVRSEVACALAPPEVAPRPTRLPRQGDVPTPLPACTARPTGCATRGSRRRSRRLATRASPLDPRMRRRAAPGALRASPRMVEVSQGPPADRPLELRANPRRARVLAQRAAVRAPRGSAGAAAGETPHASAATAAGTVVLAPLRAPARRRVRPTAA